MSILKADNVSFSYDKNISVLKDISLSIEEGEYVAILGHNGSGKSTIARLFNALLIPDKGEIIVDGLCSNDKANLFEIRKRVGVVFQNPDNQLIASIVEDDIAFGPENLGIPRQEIGKRIDFALSAVGMERYRKSTPERLSGGQKQRIAIAGVLALKPKILILDEATAMLDPIGRDEVLKVVKDLNKQGTTVITITHYMEETLKADKVVVLDEGKLILQGSPKEVFSHKEVIYNIGLELPLSAIIADKLREQGVSIPENILTKEQLVEALCKLK